MKHLPVISLAVADDHGFILDAICSYLANHGARIKVVGRAKNGLELLDVLQSTPVDVILLDLRMPEMNGFEALKIIKERFPIVKTIVYSNHFSEFYFKEVILLGANSFISKKSPTEVVLDTIKKVALDGYYITKEISKEILSNYFEQNKFEHEKSGTVLSSRELEIVKLVCEGLTYREIGEKIYVTVNTVKFHIKAIHRKTDQSSLAAVIKYAIRTGITDIDEPMIAQLTDGNLKNNL